MMRTQYEAMSVRSLWIFAAIFVFATLTNLAGWMASPRASVFALLSVAFSGLFAAAVQRNADRQAARAAQGAGIARHAKQTAPLRGGIASLLALTVTASQSLLARGAPRSGARCGVFRFFAMTSRTRWRC